MRLTAEIAKHYGQLKAQIKSLTEECDTLGKDIKETMVFRKIDEFAPEGSPFKLVKTEYDQTDVSYKDMAELAYRELYGKAWKAKFEKDVEGYGTKHIVKLEAKKNENWKEDVA